MRSISVNRDWLSYTRWMYNERENLSCKEGLVSNEKSCLREGEWVANIRGVCPKGGWVCPKSHVLWEGWWLMKSHILKEDITNIRGVCPKRGWVCPKSLRERWWITKRHVLSEGGCVSNSLPEEGLVYSHRSCRLINDNAWIQGEIGKLR